MRTRIISDLHLGHTATRVMDPVMLGPVFEGVDRVVLAGDVWQEDQRGGEGSEAGRLFAELLGMLEERGILVEVLRGNHDPGSGAGLIWLEGKSVLVMHGDAIYEDGTPWSRGFPGLRREVDEIVSRYAARSGCAEGCVDRAREIAVVLKAMSLPKLPVPWNYFLTAFWPPGRMFEMLRVWRGMGEEGLGFLERVGEGAGVFVCGHFHRAGIWERAGRVMVNTGSFMRGSRAWAVDVCEGKVTARRLDCRDGKFVPGEVKGRWILGG